MANGIATLAEAQGYLGLDPSKQAVADQQVLQLFLDGAADYVQRRTGRLLYPDPPLDPATGLDTQPSTTRTFAARGRRRIRITDLRVADSVQLDGYTLTPQTGYDLGPGLQDEPATHITLAMISPYVTVRPLWTSLLTITGRWGFSPTPPAAKDAVLFITARRWQRKVGGYADQQTTPDGGLFNFFRQLPQDVQDALADLRPAHITTIGGSLG